MFRHRYLIHFIFNLSAPGGDFQRVLDEDQVPFEQDVQRYLRQVAEGLQFMHQLNIAHLDIKVTLQVHRKKIILIENVCCILIATDIELYMQCIIKYKFLNVRWKYRCIIVFMAIMYSNHILNELCLTFITITAVSNFRNNFGCIMKDGKIKRNFLP